MHILTITYRSTNYYVLDNGKTKLLVDAGWPGTLGEFRYTLRKKGIVLKDINYMLATHYHPDHAGLAQDIKDAGAKLIVIEEQVAYVPQLKNYIKPGVQYNDIKSEGNIVISIQGSNAFLNSIGFRAQIVYTPGHSDDSITLLLDTGEAFIGDLPPNYFSKDSNDAVGESWQHLRRLGAKKIYPGHANPFSMPLFNC